MTKERLPRRIEGVKGDECDCGRRASVIHCIQCGSTRVYSRMNRAHLCMNGETRHVENQFRCITCGKLFIEEEREFCQAPPFTAILARQKAKAIHDAAKKNPDNPLLQPAVASQILREVAKQASNGDTSQTEIATSETLHGIAQDSIEEFGEESATRTKIPHGIDLPQDLHVDPDVPQITDVNQIDATLRQAFLREWSKYKYAGHKVPSFLEFCQKRLSGSRAEDIVEGA